MRHYPIASILLSSSILIFTSPAFADFEGFEEGYYQLRAASGISWLSTDNTTMGVTTNEADILTSSQSNLTAMDTLGVGYAAAINCDECDEDLRFFPGFIVSIDGSYQFETELTGDVWQYGESEFDNYHYEADIQNVNLLANLTLGLVEYNRWTLFGIGGLGAAWTWVQYEDTPKAGIPQGNLILETESNRTFAWQVGGGIGFEIIPALDLTLTYLYTDLGDIETSDDVSEANDFGGGVVITPGAFALRQQSVLLGLQWNFI